MIVDVRRRFYMDVMGGDRMAAEHAHFCMNGVKVGIYLCDIDDPLELSDKKYGHKSTLLWTAADGKMRVRGSTVDFSEKTGPGWFNAEQIMFSTHAGRLCVLCAHHLEVVVERRTYECCSEALEGFSGGIDSTVDLVHGVPWNAQCVHQRQSDGSCGLFGLGFKKKY